MANNEQNLNRLTSATKKMGLGTKLVAIITAINALGADALLASGALAIDAVAEKFKTTATAIFRIAGAYYAKAAQTAVVFSSAYTINTGAAAGSFWGAFLVQVTTAGVISTKAVAADQVYASEALAINALPAPDSGKQTLGWITVQSKSGAAWTANTDDMTAASDCLAANFYNAAPLGAVTVAPLG